MINTGGGTVIFGAENRNQNPSMKPEYSITQSAINGDCRVVESEVHGSCGLYAVRISTSRFDKEA